MCVSLFLSQPGELIKSLLLNLSECKRRHLQSKTMKILNVMCLCDLLEIIRVSNRAMNGNWRQLEVAGVATTTQTRRRPLSVALLRLPQVCSLHGSQLNFNLVCLFGWLAVRVAAVQPVDEVWVAVTATQQQQQPHTHTQTVTINTIFSSAGRQAATQTKLAHRCCRERRRRRRRVAPT